MDQTDLARVIFRKYGHLWGVFGSLSSHPFRLRIDIVWAGKFSPYTMAGMLGMIYSTCPPPNAINIMCVKRLQRKNYRPHMLVRWENETGCCQILDMLGWEIGKPVWDRKARAIRRWLRYRETANGESIHETPTPTLMARTDIR